MKNESNTYQSQGPQQLQPEIPEDAYQLLTGRIREAESERRKKLLLTIIFLIFFTLLYLSLGRSQSSAGLRLIAAGCMAGAIFLFVRTRPLRDHHYLMPMTQFLKEADKRLQYLPWQDLLLVIPILILLGIGGGMHVSLRFMKYTNHPKEVVLAWSLIYLLVCIFGYYAGKKNWNRKYGQLRSDITQFLMHMNEE